MPRKPAPKPDDPEQYKRFVELAREVEAEEDRNALDRAFTRVVHHQIPAKEVPPKSQKE